MGICKYCNSSAGFLHLQHKECKRNYEISKNQIKEAVSDFLFSTKSIDSLKYLVKTTYQGDDVSYKEIKKIIIESWIESIDKFLKDGLPKESDEKKLADLRDAFRLPPMELDRNGDLTKFAKSAIIRDVMKGIIPKKVAIIGTIPINFHNDEYIVWAFSKTKYYEYKTNYLLIGDVGSVGIPITDNFYYNWGAFEGQTIETTKCENTDTGWFVLTDKHLYFAGNNTAIRLPYSQIVSFIPYKDGIGIIKESDNAKPQIFVTDEGWFTVNLITNLTKICS